MVAFLLCLFVSANSVHQATSRLIWSFARDNGLPYSGALTRLHPTYRVPVIPLLISGVGVTILGALYCASTTAYGSIIGDCIILGNISFAIPATQLLLNRRNFNQNRWLRLGWLGAVANVVTILFCLLTTVMWLFPLTPKPAAEEMSTSEVSSCAASCPLRSDLTHLCWQTMAPLSSVAWLSSPLATGSSSAGASMDQPRTMCSRSTRLPRSRGNRLLSQPDYIMYTCLILFSA